MSAKSVINIAINGYGRIGRCLVRALCESSIHSNIQIVAINELADEKTIAHLTKYDSTHGKFPGEVWLDRQRLYINNNPIHLIHEASIDKLPWAELGVDIVLECTGAFSDRKTAEKHLSSGAQRVLFSQPAESDVDATIVYGVNESSLRPEHRIVSNASCTTNCIVPVIDIIDRAFGIDSGVITTIHSAMNDQPVIDAYHHTDLRKTRSAVQSIIPVDTGLARGIERLLPDLEGRFQAQAMRVPTVNVSAIDLSVTVKQPVDVHIINQVLRKSAEDRPRILGYTEEPLASCDFNHDSRSGIIDASQTRVAGKYLVKILTWFDNEWGFANRMLDVTEKMRQQT
ncbi:MAG: D-erythrose 4-phosphate dehydrogenase [Cellvibrionaceae bacterium]|jgi:D-erythrose 4-phosphate dehydrogenase